MHTAYQHVGGAFGGTVAFMTRRECGAWSLHGPDRVILAIAGGRFKASPHVNHPSSRAAVSVRSPIV
jgi:hypothetical protein